jgi:hypothetical protein
MSVVTRREVARSPAVIMIKGAERHTRLLTRTATVATVAGSVVGDVPGHGVADVQGEHDGDGREPR